MNLSWGRNRYDFSWETLRSFLDGVSPIDLDRLALQSREEAYQFLVQYGYDMAIPSEHHEAWTVFRDGLDYLERVLCPAPTPEDRSVGVPEELHQIADLTEILLLASHGGPLQPWACALLRVMHTISHANHAVRSPFYQEIQSQILERYRQHVHQDAHGKLHLGTGLLAVPLEDIQLREEKSRDSMILKLLHKPDNVAQGIFDRIGVKLVTPTKVDALLVLKYIRRNHLAIFANIMPGRSRNTLIDLERFRDVYESISKPGAPGTFKSNWAALQKPTEPSGEDNQHQNPHSSSAFRSIQFTCRQLIRVPKSTVFRLAGATRRAQRAHSQRRVGDAVGQAQRRQPRPRPALLLPLRSSDPRPRKPHADLGGRIQPRQLSPAPAAHRPPPRPGRPFELTVDRS